MSKSDKSDEQLKDEEKKDESSDSSKKAGEEDENVRETDEEREAREAQEAADAAKKKGEKKEDSEDDGSKKKDEKKDEEDELTTLRKTARDQKRLLDSTTVELAEMRKALQKAGLVEEEDKETVAKNKEAQALRTSTLETMAELMRLNPKYPDFDEVVTEDFADDLMEGMARVLVQNEGISSREATAKVEELVWGLTNPYKFLYDSIKANHPHFKKADSKGEDKEEDKKVGDDKDKKKKLTDLLPKKPGSIQEAAGGEGDKSGWTAAKIDELSEDELKSVPRDVYDKYLRNELK